jgi:hypothetical protein
MSSDAVPPRHAPILAVFTAAVFTSALLLFAVQPMFTRLVLPILGGAPSVWSVAMVFFQAMLLGGYLYAHVLTRTLMRGERRAAAVIVHLALVAAAGMWLPLAVATGWGDPPERHAAFWLIGLFAASIGLPFLALSANNSLLQAWFVRTGHPDGKDPYFLYAASNAGSFLALLSYPVLLEPLVALHAQTLIWTGGYWLLFGLIAACGALMLRAPAHAAIAADAESAPPVAPLAFGAWVFLAAVPSGLLVAVTAHISTDIAAAPLLWVIPLALYLLTFVLVFARRPLLPHRLMQLVQPLAIVGLVALLALAPTKHYILVLCGHLAAFVLIALACHGELARRRPPSARLTTFYLALALGGALGGLFSGLVAPNVFSWIAEYPILIALATLCRPFPTTRLAPRWELLMWGAVAVAAAAALAPSWFGWLPRDEATVDKLGYASVAIALGGALLASHPPKFAVAVAVALAMIRLYPSDERHVRTTRSFFGVYKIFDTADGRFRVLQNGTTIHGAQMLKDAQGNPDKRPPKLLTYYAPGFGMAQTIEAVRNRKGAPISAAIVGLGTGSLTCYRQPGDDFTVFEIDVVAVALARDSGLFDYVHDCATDIPIVIGDARRMLAREPDGRFDLILVDAFSSDTIPVHLITRDAMAMYRRKLAPHGVVLMHVSNRYLELASVVAGVAAADGLRSWESGGENGDADDLEYVFTSDVVIAAEHAGDIGELADGKDFTPSTPDPTQRVWTDDYSNIVGALWRK